MNTTKTEEVQIGSFKVKSGKVFVSDPCYDLNTWCAGTIKNVKNGNWVASVIVSNQREFGKRIASLIAVHESSIFPYDGWVKEKFEVGVDSGQAGIYDYPEFRGRPEFRGGDSEEWYQKCCNLTLSAVSAGIIEKSGVVSSSGFGDGSYVCSTVTQNKKVIAIKIDFFPDEEDE